MEDSAVLAESSVAPTVELAAPASLLAPPIDADEPLLARRTEATLTNIGEDGLPSLPSSGSLYLTDRRLLHVVGGLTTGETAIDLRDVNELSVAGERPLITLRGLRGVIIDTESPIQFRAHVALAINALRGRQENART